LAEDDANPLPGAEFLSAIKDAAGGPGYGKNALTLTKSPAGVH
jgi:hypothetical protein